MVLSQRIRTDYHGHSVERADDTALGSAGVSQSTLRTRVLKVSLVLFTSRPVLTECKAAYIVL